MPLSVPFSGFPFDPTFSGLLKVEIIIIIMCVCMHTCVHDGGAQISNGLGVEVRGQPYGVGGWFSPSTFRWVLWTKLKSSGFSLSAFS